MARSISTLVRTLLDLTVLSLAYFGAYAVRFNGVPDLQMVKLMGFTWPYVVGLELAVLYFFSVPYFAWRYISLREAQRVLWATGVSTAVLLAVRLAAPAVTQLAARPAVHFFDYAEYLIIPFGVIVGNAVLAFLGVNGVRFARRLMVERVKRQGSHLRRDRVPTLLLGAGQAGVLFAKEIGTHPDLPLRAVGFLDDDSSKLGTIVHGVKVLGKTSEIAEITRVTGARQAIITVANASPADIRRIHRLCEGAEIPVKIMPGLYEILDGKVNLTRIRDVSIEDLLGRDAVTLDLDLIREFIQGKRVMITGAGGSIGSELCRQIAKFAPLTLALVEQNEFNLFTVHQELLAKFPSLTLRPVICDVCDSERVDHVFAEELPEVVFHAAAHKHVPMMEWNPGEAVKNNVFGTKKIADAADRFGCGTFVLISTDKAVNPTSVMGTTKRAAEMYIQALAQSSSTKYVAVRFGNVLGSTGSVVPIFKAQIAAGGPVTVTHQDMTRYFMTIPEASQLVMQAAAMGETSEIMVLDMGEPVRIMDLAEELIRLSGLEPQVDIEIKVTGMRSGEKLFEELSFDAEKMSKTRHDKIFVGNMRPCSLADVSREFEALAVVTNSTSLAEVRHALSALVPEMRAGGPDSIAPAASASSEVEDAVHNGVLRTATA